MLGDDDGIKIAIGGAQGSQITRSARTCAQVLAYYGREKAARGQHQAAQRGAEGSRLQKTAARSCGRSSSSARASPSSSSAMEAIQELRSSRRCSVSTAVYAFDPLKVTRSGVARRARQEGQRRPARPCASSSPRCSARTAIAKWIRRAHPACEGSRRPSPSRAKRRPASGRIPARPRRASRSWTALRNADKDEPPEVHPGACADGIGGVGLVLALDTVVTTEPRGRPDLVPDAISCST